MNVLGDAGLSFGHGPRFSMELLLRRIGRVVGKRDDFDLELGWLRKVLR